MQKTDPIAYGLFAIRVTVFVFMAMWALVKITAPASYGVSDDGAGIFGSFYGISLSQNVVLMIGLAQIAFLVAFVAGVAKVVTTGGVLLMNLTTLLVSLPTILPAVAGGGNLLFAASMPVFGASLALFLARDRDTFLSVGQPPARTSGAAA